MSLVRRIARPLLAAPYIAAGIAALRHPESADGVSAGSAQRITSRIPQLADSGPDTAVRAQGALMVGAATLLALGRMPRPAALVLAACVLPATLERAKAAKEKDGDPAQRAELLHSAGAFGGLLLAAADTHGKPSVAWRARKISKRAGTVAELSTKTAGRAARTAGATTKAAGSTAKAGVSRLT